MMVACVSGGSDTVNHGCAVNRGSDIKLNEIPGSGSCRRSGLHASDTDAEKSYRLVSQVTCCALFRVHDRWNGLHQ
jgi:hypothetical protein